MRFWYHLLHKVAAFRSPAQIELATYFRNIVDNYILPPKQKHKQLAILFRHILLLSRPYEVALGKNPS